MKVTITPSEAAGMLDKSTGINYRHLDKTRVKNYSQMMKDGNWEYNGETIKLDPDGIVRDGQHRLAACVLSECSFLTEVVRNVVTTREVDRGKARRLSDALRQEGFGSHMMLGSIIKWCWQYAHRRVMTPNSAPSIAEGLRMAENNKFQEATKTAYTMPLIFRNGIAGATIVLSAFSENENGLSDEFWVGVKTGRDLSEDDPRLRLRSRVINEKASIRKTMAYTRFALHIKAFNAFAEDRPIRSLKWTRLRKDKEPFPDMVGCPPDHAGRNLVK